MNNKAKEARRAYFRQYYKKNKDKINKYQRDWRSTPEGKKKVQEYNKRYWEKKAKELE